MTQLSSARTVREHAGTNRIPAVLTGAGLEKLLGLERAYVELADRLAISQRLREARENAGFEQSAMADMLIPPVTVRSIHNYEHGRVPFRYLRQWAEITGVSYEWLLNGDTGPAAASSSPDAPVPGADLLLDRLEAQEARLARLDEQLARIEKMLEKLLRVLGDPSSDGGDLPVRVVHVPVQT